MSSPQALADRALQATSADRCIVVVRCSSQVNLRWANNTLTTNGVMTKSIVTVVSVLDGPGGAAVGVRGSAVADRAGVEQLVAATDAAARAAGPAADSMPFASGGESADWTAGPGSTSVAVFDQLAQDLGSVFTRARKQDRLLYGYVDHRVDTTYLATSEGLRLRHEQPTGYLAITGKPTGLSTSAWVGRPTVDFTDIEVAALDDELARRIGWAANRVDLPAGRYETLLPPTAVADLILYAYFVACGLDAADGRTAFSDPAGGTRVGQQIVDPRVTLVSDPGLAGLGATPFLVAPATTTADSVFDNGQPLDRTPWIENGILRALVTSRHTAETTGLGFHPRIGNLALSVGDGTASLDDLVASTERALLVTSLWYIRQVDPQELLLTGLTRDGVYLVENGKVTGAVNNFRFNESPLSLLNRFTEAGATVRSLSREWGDGFSRTATPPLRIPDFNMSSVSPAS
ncbi:MAG TPA: metallopeptidase TldD-related protein [Nocardioidaceae bacterium]|nr:metallopeptidase TldD-related protein [Nocardioidaceae bacterium]